MAPTKTIDDELVRKERVVAAVDMPGIPAGTKGKVTFVEGFTWIRYWVRFENGVVRGSINRNKLVRPAEWGRIQERRALGITDEDEADDETASASADGDGATGEAVAAGASVNGVAVPAHLLERSVNRRQVLGK